MAGRFPLYTDADVHGPVVAALKLRGWDILRAVDAFLEGTDDETHFAEAARVGRVLVSNDDDQIRIAVEWLRTGRAFRGLIIWPQAYYARMSVGDVLARFEEYAAQEDPFGECPLIYLRPPR